MTGLVTGLAVKTALGNAWDSIKAGAKWFFAHPAWLVALAFGILFLLKAGEVRHDEKRLSADKTTISGLRGEVADLGTKLTAQNAAVAHWQAEAQAQHNAATAALATAQKKGDSDRKRADQIDATPPPKTSAPCPTPDSVKGIDL